MLITETTTPAPDYTITVELRELGWSYTITSPNSASYSGTKHEAYRGRFFSRGGATRAAKRHVKKLVAERTRTYTVTV